MKDFRNQIDNNNSSSSHESLVFQIPHGHKPGTFPTSLAHKQTVLSPITDGTSVNWRTGSFHGYRGRSSCRRRGGASSPPAGDRDLSSSSPLRGTTAPAPSPLATLDHRLSIYDNVPGDQLSFEGEVSSGGGGSDAERMGEETEVSQQIVTALWFTYLHSIIFISW